MSAPQHITIRFTITHYRLGGGSIVASFYAGNGPPLPDEKSNIVGHARISNRSLTSKVIRDRLAVGKFKEMDGNGNYLSFGHVSMTINLREHTATWDEYYPFSSISSIFLGPFQKAQRKRFAFRQSGIAQLLEYRVLEKVKHEFSFVETIRHRFPSHLRRIQLKERGLPHEEDIIEYSFSEAMRKLRQKIGSDARTYKHDLPPETRSRARKLGRWVARTWRRFSSR
jgi:hypothetical protein